MPQQFYELRERLLRAGVAPRYVTRYLNELTDHFADLTAEEEHAGSSRRHAESAALVRLGSTDDLAKAMMEQHQFQSWCVRAPWATLVLVPLFILAAAWFAGVLISLSGFNAPLSSADQYASALHQVRIGAWIFLGAPIFISWWIVLVAARQRFTRAWPVIGLMANMLVASTLRVYYTGFAFSEIGGGMRFGGIGFASVLEGLLTALLILFFTLLPYLTWRIQNARSV